MIAKIAGALAVIVAGFLVFVALQPADYTISRQITINAPVEKIFPYLNNSKLAEKWGPWTEEDPEAKMVYSGPDEGVGSKASWDSPGKLGTGSATIVETIPNEKVGIKLEYTKPMTMIQDAEYLVQNNGSQTVVTWKVSGKNTFPGRVMCFFINMDKMVGSMFEKGLANLKALAEQ